MIHLAELKSWFQIVEASIKLLKEHDGPHKILDLGTGSGCLLLSILSELPDLRGTGVDISQPALEVGMWSSHS